MILLCVCLNNLIIKIWIWTKSLHYLYAIYKHSNSNVYYILCTIYIYIYIYIYMLCKICIYIYIMCNIYIYIHILCTGVMMHWRHWPPTTHATPELASLVSLSFMLTSDCHYVTYEPHQFIYFYYVVSVKLFITNCLINVIPPI